MSLYGLYPTRREYLWSLLEYIRWEYYKNKRGFVTFPGLFGLDERTIHNRCQELADKGLLKVLDDGENVCVWIPGDGPYRYYI